MTDRKEKTSTGAKMEEDRLSQLKKERDAQAKDSAEYRALVSKVSAMEGKLKELQEHLSALKSASVGQWRAYQTKVNDNLANLEKISQQSKAE